MKSLYTAIATAEGGRTGHVRSSDGIIDLDLRMPKALGGPGGEGTKWWLTLCGTQRGTPLPGRRWGSGRSGG